MAERITLRRVNDDDGNWVYYECSKCGKMSIPDLNDGAVMPNLFKAHVVSEHSAKRKPREDVNQVAARIVREATQDR